MNLKFSYKSVISFFKYYRFPLLSGILLGTSYIPFPPVALFVAWIPLWHFIFKQKNLKQVLIGAWLCQFLSTLIGFNWVAYTIHHFGGMPWAVSVLGLLCFCSFANIFMVLAGGLWFILFKNTSRSPVPCLFFPVLYSLFHTLTPTIFPWNMGYSWFAAGLPAFQTAELWGFRFLNTLSYLFNFIFWIVLKYRWSGMGQKAFAAAFSLFAALNIWGFYLKKRLPEPDKEAGVLMVQHNVGQLLKLKRRFKNPQARSAFILKEWTYKGLMQSRRFWSDPKNIHFVLWPEGAWPYLVSKDASWVKGASHLAKKIKVPLITGVPSKGERGYGNSIMVISREGELLKPIYDKSLLLAFGEYMPGFFNLSFIRKFFPYFQGRFAPGNGPEVFHLEKLSLGFQICYESLFDSYARKLSQKGSKLLVNVTNDSWYGVWQESRQHLYMGLARAIETRRPFIRSTNTGFSTVIKADGSIMEISPFNKKWVHFYKVPYNEKPKDTLFLSWGFYINEIFLLFLSLFGFVPDSWRRNIFF